MAAHEPLMFAAHEQDPNIDCIRSAFLPGEIKIVALEDEVVGTGRIAIFTAPESLTSGAKRQEVQAWRLSSTVAQWAIPTHRRFAISAALGVADFRAEVTGLRQELIQQKAGRGSSPGRW